MFKDIGKYELNKALILFELYYKIFFLSFYMDGTEAHKGVTHTCCDQYFILKNTS